MLFMFKSRIVVGPRSLWGQQRCENQFSTNIIYVICCIYLYVINKSWMQTLTGSYLSCVLFSFFFHFFFYCRALFINTWLHWVHMTYIMFMFISFIPERGSITLCGNQVREPTEDCDCGANDECGDSCCTDSCQLAASANCRWVGSLQSVKPWLLSGQSGTMSVESTRPL